MVQCDKACALLSGSVCVCVCVCVLRGVEVDRYFSQSGRRGEKKGNGS